MLLVGAAESITKEMFRNLLVCNIRKVNLKENINLPAKLVLSAHTDTELAELIFNIIADEGNPAEKLNFQNMRQLQAVMKSYLRIDVPDELISALHKYWQIRHIIIHNSAIIEQRFLDNLKKAGISVDEYILAQKVKVTKEDYDKCSGLLMLLFETFDDEIERLKLDYAIS